MSQATVDCMLSGGCALPLNCTFSATVALGYLVPSWSHGINVTVGDTVLTVTMEVEGETVESFDAGKQVAFRDSVAAVLGVDASLVELTIRALPAHESSLQDGSWASGSYEYGSGGDASRRLSGGGIEIVVTVRSSEGAVLEAAQASL